MGWISWFITLLLYAALAIAAARGLGTPLGIALYSLVVVMLVALAGFALKNSPVGKITWKNRLAGWFLPWTRWIGGEQLGTLLLRNAVVSILFGWLLIWCDRNGLLDELLGLKTRDGSQRSSWIQLAILWTTVSCWLILSLAWLRLLQTWAKNHPRKLAEMLKSRDSWPALSIPPAAVAFSVALHYADRPIWALTVVAIPLLIALGPILLMVMLILWQQVRGKPIRWN
jgi:hypothetical protein